MAKVKAPEAAEEVKAEVKPENKPAKVAAMSPRSARLFANLKTRKAE
jgi:hypothetical protein